MRLHVLILMTVWALGARAFAQAPEAAGAEGGEAQAKEAPEAVAKSEPAGPTGYIDADRDGVNDRFCDANGDGVNDVTGEPYEHRFVFRDGDEDGVNDVFTDADGDGVNDLDATTVDRDGDGVCDNVIDADGDGRNDITGAEIAKDSLDGFRYGRVDEERKRVHLRFTDEDGDGMHDYAGRGRWGGGMRRMDRFVDEDGDGICDGRTIRGRGAEDTGQDRRRRGRSGGGHGRSE